MKGSEIMDKIRVTTLDYGYHKNPSLLLADLRLRAGDKKTIVVYGKNQEVAAQKNLAVICIERRKTECYGFINIYF